MLKAAKQRSDQQLIQTVLLRSLSQAVYAPELDGHFGLALDDYAHYTSPIRRYPDLLVHRGIRHVLRHGSRKGFRYSHSDMESLGEHCSMTERRADEATRDAVAWLKAEYMQDKVGETFQGVVSGVTGFGLFVEIKDVYIEGLVHVTSLDNDFYHFDPARHSLTGERGGRVFRIGDELTVQVVRVSLDDRKIDLALAEESESESAPAPRKKSRKRRRKDKSEATGETADQASAKEEPGSATPPGSTAKKGRRRGRRRSGGDASTADAKTAATGEPAAAAPAEAGADAGGGDDKPRQRRPRGRRRRSTSSDG